MEAPVHVVDRAGQLIPISCHPKEEWPSEGRDWLPHSVDPQGAATEPISGVVGLVVLAVPPGQQDVVSLTIASVVSPISVRVLKVFVKVC